MKEWYSKILAFLKSLLEYDVVVVDSPAQIVPPPPNPPTPPTRTSQITDWANAIKQYEGWTIGSSSWRHNNPGNLREWGNYPVKGGFVQFSTPQEGFNALCTLLTNACTGKSKVYSPTMTLREFYHVYAPSSDKNDPDKYAEWIANKLGVHPDDLISTLV